MDKLVPFFLMLIPGFFGIICHEISHGYVAYLLGDPTAKKLGRLTFNPLKHLDPAGTTVLLATAFFSPVVFGWAKPVPVHAGYFKRPRRDMMLVSFAGPFANFAVAFLCMLLLLTLGSQKEGILYYVSTSAYYGILMNCYLAWFNLLPIPPLDGGHILEGLLPLPLAQAYNKISRYGIFLLLIILYFGLHTTFILPLVEITQNILYLGAQFILKAFTFVFA